MPFKTPQRPLRHHDCKIALFSNPAKPHYASGCNGHDFIVDAVPACYATPMMLEHSGNKTRQNQMSLSVAGRCSEGQCIAAVEIAQLRSNR